MKTICPVCRSKKSLLFLRTKSRNLRACKTCDLIYVWPQPDKSSIKKLYRSEYFQVKNGREILGYRDYESQKLHLEPYFRKQLDTINKLRNGRRGRILDVGCAFGFFLELAKKDGWRVVGHDVSRYAIEKVREKGIEAANGELSKAGFKKSSFDVVTTFQTIEHDLDPVGLLSDARRVLVPGGLLVLTTIDRRGILPVLLGEKWHDWQTEPHVVWFDKKSLCLVFEKAGFKKVEIEKDILSWNSLDDIFEAVKYRYPSSLSFFVYNKIVKRLPRRIKLSPVIPQIPLRGLRAVAVK